MSGRHRVSQPSTRSVWPWIAGAGLLAVVVAFVGVGLASDGGSSDSAASDSSGSDAAGAACDERTVLTVAAAPAIAPVVEQVVSSAAAQEAVGSCTDVSVEPVASAAFAESGDPDVSAALWIPEASLWVDTLADRLGEEEVETLGSMASSPVVLAATPAAAAQLAGTEPEGAVDASWTRVLDGTTPVATVDPTTSTEGVTTLTTIQTVLGAEPGQDPPLPLVQSFVGLSRAVVPTVDDAFALTADPTTSPMFATSEQSVVSHNRQSDEDSVVPVYPTEGTTILDYPVVRLPLDGQAAGTAAEAAALGQVLLAAEASSVAQEAGFRSPDGEAQPDGQEGMPADSPAALPAPTAELAQDALRTWSAVTLDSRMLAVIDVSGSMDQDAGNGRTRAQLARDATVAASRIYPDTAQIGLWAFSELQDPPNHWVPLLDVGPLGDDLGEGSRREAFVAQAATLPSRVQGGTGLYDTTLAAFRSMRSTYDPSRVNSVVILTDGRNRDVDGIDLDTLLTALRAEFDPANPVTIIPVAMGADVDMNVLSQIAELTGGKAYQALDPADIQTVFLDAMVERRCRPSC